MPAASWTIECEPPEPPVAMPGSTKSGLDRAASRSWTRRDEPARVGERRRSSRAAELAHRRRCLEPSTSGWIVLDPVLLEEALVVALGVDVAALRRVRPRLGVEDERVVGDRARSKPGRRARGAEVVLLAVARGEVLLVEVADRVEDARA